MTGARRGTGRIGLLVPFTNTNVEPDMALLAPPGVTLHVARMGGYDAEEIPDSAQMAGLGSADIDEPLRLLAGSRPDVILYACTSATLAHGAAFDADLAARCKAAAGVPVVTAAGALVSALKELSVRRIAFASPYVADLNDRAVTFLAEAGIRTVSRADTDRVLDNEGQGAMPPEAVAALGRRADSAEAEALVLSCTDMRAVEAIEELEAALGKPVVTSNQALAFAACRVLGLAALGPGRLLRRAVGVPA